MVVLYWFAGLSPILELRRPERDRDPARLSEPDRRHVHPADLRRRHRHLPDPVGPQPRPRHRRGPDVQGAAAGLSGQPRRQCRRGEAVPALHLLRPPRQRARLAEADQRDPLERLRCRRGPDRRRPDRQGPRSGRRRPRRALVGDAPRRAQGGQDGGRARRPRALDRRHRLLRRPGQPRGARPRWRPIRSSSGATSRSRSPGGSGLAGPRRRAAGRLADPLPAHARQRRRLRDRPGPRREPPRPERQRAGRRPDAVAPAREHGLVVADALVAPRASCRRRSSSTACRA